MPGDGRSAGIGRRMTPWQMLLAGWPLAFLLVGWLDQMGKHDAE